MKFSTLAQYLDKLEKTSSRNEMTVILADLFGQAEAADAKLITYLAQGRLGPAYNSPDFGVADKMMLRALGGRAVSLFKRLGDLGLVTQELSRGKGNLSVEGVHSKLLEIAASSGTGSQEKKQSLIRELLKQLDSVSAKYAVKIILGKLRTGFSDMTILDSLSWMVIGDKSLRKNIESVYNVRADLGEIAKLAKEIKDIKRLKMEPEIGTPVLMAKAERATSAAEIWERNGECALEYKLDGLRIQAHVSKTKIVLFSRGLENVTAMYPDIVEGLRRSIKNECIVEGEMIAVGKDGKFLPFQETVQRKRKYNIAEMTSKIPLRIYLFDILLNSDEGVLDIQNSKRREMLENLGEYGNTVRLMPRRRAYSVSDIEEFFAKALTDGTEGIVAKKLDGTYQAGSRDFNWIKYKKSYDRSALADTIDAVVMGYDVGQGKRAGFGIGDFLIGVYDSQNDRYLTVAKIGTGLTDEEWRKMRGMIDDLRIKNKPGNFEVKKEMTVDVWCKPKIVVEIQADEVTRSPMHSSSWALRFPRLISWREKKPEDATSIEELRTLAAKQKR